VHRAHHLTLNEMAAPGGELRQVEFESAAATVGEALAGAGVELYESDRVSPPLSTPLSADLAVTVERGTPVTIEADGGTWVSRTRQTTVAGLLGEVGLALDGGDYVLPGLDSPLAPGQVVQVVRAGGTTLVEREPLPYDTLYVPDPDLEIDQQRGSGSA
ncbi:MAG: ubiquitin-like domain-containing protein, partial [Chloroflexota bacterium]